MNRVLMLACLASALLCSTGCRSTNNACCGNVGCRPCEMGWQRGGTDYQRFLQGPGCNCGSSCSTGACGNQACGNGGGGGLLGGRLAGIGQGRLAGAASGLANHSSQYNNSQPAGAGEASGTPVAQVAYPYYTTRGPRDFFLDNPPSIGR